MKEWQQRVHDEMIQLEQRVCDLSAFGDSEKFETLPIQEQVYLNVQFVHMKAYLDILQERIASFGKTK